METVITSAETCRRGWGPARVGRFRNRRHQEGDPAEAPSPRRTARRDQALALQRAYEERQKELQQAASQQYRENRRFRAARVREERERIVSGGCADDVVVEETAQNYQTKLAYQYRENRAKARSYERCARDDLQGPCATCAARARGEPREAHAGKTGRSP